MRFLADVNLPQSVIQFLRKAGYDVLDIKVTNPTIGDVEIIKLAIDDHRIILTLDKDFQVLVQYPKYQIGVIAIRLKIQDAKHYCEMLKDLLETKTEDDLIKSLTILQEEVIESFPY